MRVRGVRGRPGKTHPTGGVRGLMQFQQLPQIHVCKPCKTKVFLILFFFSLLNLRTVVYVRALDAPGSIEDFTLTLLRIAKTSYPLMTKQTKRIISVSPSFFPLPIVRPRVSFSPAAQRKIKGPSACVYMCVKEVDTHQSGGLLGCGGVEYSGLCIFQTQAIRHDVCTPAYERTFGGERPGCCN